MPTSNSAKCVLSPAFTLIELSIVLVIIGLIVGGLLVGRDLIKTAEVRATITQVEKFNTAANTFFGKYGYLPGDIPAAPAAQFGFAPRGQYAGEGDGNGLIEGVNHDAANQNYGDVEGKGETTMFWVDLSAANLIEGGFSSASSTMGPGTITQTTSPLLSSFLPEARLGKGNYIYAWSGGGSYSGLARDGKNYLGLSAITSINDVSCGGCSYSNPGLTVAQAQSIDTKMDDGYPKSGRVKAFYIDFSAFGLGGAGWSPNAASASGTTCFDTTSLLYSINIRNGNNVNCALSFQMQAGD